jgi:hypothetical protein
LIAKCPSAMRAILVGALASMCGTGSARAEPPAAETTPVTLAAGSPPAPWLEHRRVLNPGALQDRVDWAIGLRSGLVKTGNDKYFLVTQPDGAVGPLAIPEGSRWVGLGMDDTVLVASSEGALSRLRDGKLQRLGVVLGAKSWDAADAVVAAVTGDRVAVSGDGGLRFRESVPARGVKLVSVLARRDGVIVAIANEATFISRNRGKTWARSAHHGVAMTRVGGAIFDPDPDCQVTLASDGKTWVGGNPRVGLHRWAEDLELSAAGGYLSSFAHASLTSVTAPPPVKDRDGGEDICVRASAGVPPTGFGYGIGRDVRQSALGPLPWQTATGFGLIGDGVCAPSSGSPRLCVPDAPQARMPKVAILDRTRGAVALHSLPPGCIPEESTILRGIGLVLCRGATSSRIYSMTAEGAWHDEGRVTGTAFPLAGEAQAADGTIALFPPCYRSEPTCRVLVRAPVAAGGDGGGTPWREVAVAGAIGYVALERGAVLALVALPTAPGAQTERFRLVLEDGGKTETLVEEVAVDGKLATVAVDAAGRLLIGLRAPQGAKRWVARDGQLIPVPSDK